MKPQDCRGALPVRARGWAALPARRPPALGLGLSSSRGSTPPFILLPAVFTVCSREGMTSLAVEERATVNHAPFLPHLLTTTTKGSWESEPYQPRTAMKTASKLGQALAQHLRYQC